MGRSRRGRSERKRPGREPQVLQEGLGGGGAKDDGHHATRAPQRGQVRTSVWPMSGPMWE